MNFDRILVIQTAYLGDAVLCIPLLKALRSHYPGSRITYLVRKGLGEFFTATGLIDGAIEVDKGDDESLARVLDAAKARKPDLVVSAHRSFRTALWVWRSGARVRIGFRDPWSVFAYNRVVRRPVDQHDVIRQLSLMEGLGMPVDSFPAGIKSLEVNLADNPKFENLVGAIAIAPGSQWNTKRWTTQGFADVAARLENQRNKIVLFGAGNEKEICGAVAARLKNPINLCGQTTVLELAQALKKTKLLICNDSGTMHVATAVGVPVISIFGPTIQAQGYRPWSERSHVVEVLNLKCRPCGAHGHQACPLGHHHCMTQISPEKVFGAAQDFLT